MKLFYESYASNEKLAPLAREIGWKHNIVIQQDSVEQDCKFYVSSTF